MHALDQLTGMACTPPRHTCAPVHVEPMHLQMLADPCRAHPHDMHPYTCPRITGDNLVLDERTDEWVLHVKDAAP